MGEKRPLYPAISAPTPWPNRSQAIVPITGCTLCDWHVAHGFTLLTDCAGSSVEVTYDEQKSREQRLNGNQKTLYHQTSPDSAQAILKSQQMRRGTSGLAGGGVYFAASAAETDGKAQSKGTILRATVRLGNVKTVFRAEPSITFRSLLKEGFDSVLLKGRPSGDEYIVYNFDQVSNIQDDSHYDSGWQGQWDSRSGGWGSTGWDSQGWSSATWAGQGWSSGGWSSNSGQASPRRSSSPEDDPFLAAFGPAYEAAFGPKGTSGTR